MQEQAKPLVTEPAQFSIDETAELSEVLTRYDAVQKEINRLVEEKDELINDMVVLMGDTESVNSTIGLRKFRVTVVRGRSASYKPRSARAVLSDEAWDFITSLRIDPNKFKQAVRLDIITKDLIDDVVTFTPKKPYIRYTPLSNVVEYNAQRRAAKREGVVLD